MLYYSFNDYFCKNYDFNLLQKHLLYTLKEYRDIKIRFPKNIEGILTDRDISSLKINENSNLLQLILSLNRDEKNYALSLFKKYPIETFYPDLEVDNILENEYLLTVNNINYDAINAKINSLHDGFLFSFGIHNDLRKDQLEIKEKNEKEDICLIDNLFGETENSKYNISQISNKINDSKLGFEKFLSLFQNPIYYDSFKTEYEGLSTALQDRIYDRMFAAKNRGLPTPFASDKDLIKDVTPEKENQIKIYELRIFEPVCTRLYFYEDNQNIYLSSITKKPAKKSQSADIRTNISAIKTLIKTNK